jgi:hypothetical protein
MEFANSAEAVYVCALQGLHGQFAGMRLAGSQDDPFGKSTLWAA